MISTETLIIANATLIVGVLLSIAVFQRLSSYKAGERIGFGFISVFVVPWFVASTFLSVIYGSWLDPIHYWASVGVMLIGLAILMFFLVFLGVISLIKGVTESKKKDK